MANKIQFRRGIKAQLPTLSVGEPALTTDTKEVFVGHADGNIGIATMSQLADIEMNVRSKGAKVDGVTDDTAAAQAAIDEVHSAGGGIVKFPAGTCMVSGLILKDFVTLQGVGKLSSVIKLINGANNHVISTQDFDSLVGTNPGAEGLVKTGGIKGITIDGNKENQTEPNHGFAYLGIDLQVEEVEIKKCKGIGLWAESSTGIWSVTVGQNLQSNIRHIESHDNDLGNIYYNGQSDSNLIDIMCYQTGTAGQFNFKLGPKAPGVRVFGLHCWGDSDYGIINEAPSAAFSTCHVESASVAKVYMKAATYFEGRVYQVGVVEELPHAAPAFLIAAGVGSNNIRTTISGCDIGVKFEGADGGNSLFDIQMYTARSGASLFSGTPSITNMIRARLIGASTSNYFQMPNLRSVPGSPVEFSNSNTNYSFWSDESKTLRQFAIEHAAVVESYLAVMGGGATGPQMLVRGTAADYDIRLVPKGAGLVRFGTYASQSDVPITGSIRIKDANGVTRKLATID